MPPYAAPSAAMPVLVIVRATASSEVAAASAPVNLEQQLHPVVATRHEAASIVRSQAIEQFTLHQPARLHCD